MIQGTGSVALVVAAHPDDEVLGCGATIARMRSDGWSTHAVLATSGITSRKRPSDHGSNRDEVKRLRQATAAAHAVLGIESSEALDLPDNRLDSVDLLDVVQSIEAAIERVKPSRVLTHHRWDVNIDHQIVHEAVLAATRPQPASSVREVLFFETQSSTEWRGGGSASSFQPQVWVDVSQHLQVKMEALHCYGMEMREWPHARSFRAVEALAAWRGATIGVDAAEAFELGRSIREY